MADEKLIRDIDEYFAPAVRLHTEIGWTGPVERLIRNYGWLATEFGSPKTRAIFFAAGKWLEMAKDHEAIHGKNSLLNHDHLNYAETIRKVRERDGASNLACIRSHVPSQFQIDQNFQSER